MISLFRRKGSVKSNLFHNLLKGTNMPDFKPGFSIVDENEVQANPLRNVNARPANNEFFGKTISTINKLFSNIQGESTQEEIPQEEIPTEEEIANSEGFDKDIFDSMSKGYQQLVIDHGYDYGFDMWQHDMNKN